MTPRAATAGRSKEHHVAVGLGFWSAFKNGEIDACVEALHPDVEFHPTPKLDELDAVRGREEGRSTLQAMHDRFADGLEVLPEDGRQIGDHVLMVTMLKGRNQFTKQAINSRECWVVTIRDDKMARIVAYPNAPAARLGFGEPHRGAGAATAAAARPAVGAETNPPAGPPQGVTLAPEMENSTATPAEL